MVDFVDKHKIKNKTKLKALAIALKKFRMCVLFLGLDLTSLLKAKLFKVCPLSTKAIALEILQGYSICAFGG